MRLFFAAMATLLLLKPACVTAQRLNTTEQALVLSGDTSTMFRVIQITAPEELKILHTASVDVDPSDPLIPVLSKRMYLAMRDINNPGIGIAAPQIGINRNVIWVKRYDKEGEPFEFYLNPKITWQSELMRRGKEGCLSIPDVSGDVIRHYLIKLDYLDVDGMPKAEIIEGFTAVIFQHETDHLNGILFTDRLKAQEGKVFNGLNGRVDFLTERLLLRP